MYSHLLHFSLFLLLATPIRSYTPLPRWGQAAALINDALFIYGGKVDEFNSYSYTAAPNQNDILFLPLSDPFDLSAPPWELVSNATVSQGRELAWHTLTPFNASQSLSFGGQPGPDAPMGPVPPVVLDTSDHFLPTWNTDASAWGGVPANRIRHTATTTPSGQVFIIGGERPDGSRNGFADHYVFDIGSASFSALPADGGPPDIYGHATVLLPDGRLLVFGGFSQSLGALLPFSQIWVLDTRDASASWSSIRLDQDSEVPSPRRAFAFVTLSDHLVLIQGGSDGDLQRNFDDGWILDLSNDPPSWSPVPSLVEVGPRRDHFAVLLGNQVFFGFGYENDAAAPASLIIYDWSDNSFVSAYNPPPPPPTPSHTIPTPTQTGGHESSPGSGPGAPHTNQPSGVNPTNSPSDNPNQPTPTDSPASSSPTTAIALGTVFGILALLVGGAMTVYYVRRRRSQSRQAFAPLYGPDNPGDGTDSLHLGGEIPTVGGYHTSGPGALLYSLGFTGVLGGIRTERERRDMLADEDTREFGEWHPHRRGGTDNSSWSWSWKSIVAPQRPSRTPSSNASRMNTFEEKGNPFADDASLLRDEDIVLAAVSTNEKSGHHNYPSYASRTSRASYADPFADPISSGPEHLLRNVEQPPDLSTPPPPRLLPPIITTDTPYKELTPGPANLDVSTGATSQNDGPSSQSSRETLSPFGSSSAVSSSTSQDHRQSILPTASLLNPSPPGSQFIKRSDTWWGKFAKSSFLDRRSSDGSRRSPKFLDIRDPNPPPALLVAIEESVAAERSNKTSESDAVNVTDGRPYGPHGISMTSFQTSGTADTEFIERIAGTMDVVQRAMDRDARRTGSTLSVETRSFEQDPDQSSHHQSSQSAFEDSPVPKPPPSAYPSRSLPRPGAVAARVQAFERRFSQDQEQIISPTSPIYRQTRRQTKDHEVNYGLIPKPNLFITNPDRRSTSS
ncbi:hypothetical protein AX16_002659 [Volvariella volvacea WC 439]|nr:hypothetical protein AX16_002659 [Volvariella volvacea WC 439]